MTDCGLDHYLNWCFDDLATMLNFIILYRLILESRVQRWFRQFKWQSGILDAIWVIIDLFIVLETTYDPSQLWWKKFFFSFMNFLMYETNILQKKKFQTKLLYGVIAICSSLIINEKVYGIQLEWLDAKIAKNSNIPSR